MRAYAIVPAFLLGALLSGGLSVPALAQSPPALTYSQPVTAGGIREVQDKLRAAGAFDGPVDGNWGAESEAALQRYQQGNGLQPTGQLNPATVALLGLNAGELVTVPAPSAPPPAQAAAAPPPPPTAHAPFQLSEDSIRIVQSRLRQLGFYDGGVDGVWGGGTQQGMQAFERARSLPVTEGLNSQTVTAMGIDPASMQPR